MCKTLLFILIDILGFIRITHDSILISLKEYLRYSRYL